MNIAHLSQYVSTLEQRKAFNGAILVAKGKKTLMAEGLGYANVEHQIPNAPRTKFRIGSVTKTFTALATLMLEEDRLLSTGDPINDYLSDGSSVWASIKIHHLLTHTAGLVHPWNSSDFVSQIAAPRSIDEIISSFRDTPLLFSPGEKYHYGGLAYFLLAQIIEEVSGQTYEQFLRERIFTPLGMNDTGADHYKKVLRNRASGYTTKDGALTHDEHIYMPVITGGGNLYSTINDLRKWDVALCERRFLATAGYERMYHVTKNNYGYGWNIGQYNGSLELRHSGGAPGFSSHMLRIPADRVCVVILSNVVRNHHNPKKVISIANDLRHMIYDD